MSACVLVRIGQNWAVCNTNIALHGGSRLLVVTTENPRGTREDAHRIPQSMGARAAFGGPHRTQSGPIEMRIRAAGALGGA